MGRESRFRTQQGPKPPPLRHRRGGLGPESHDILPPAAPFLLERRWSYTYAGFYLLSEIDISEVAYESRVEIRRLGGPTRSATLPAESEPVLFGAHGAIAEHYGLDATKFEPHAATIDYVVAAAGG